MQVQKCALKNAFVPPRCVAERGLGGEDWILGDMGMETIKRLAILIALLLITAGCNLSRTDVAVLPTDTASVTEAVPPRATRTPIPFGGAVTNLPALPTLLPLPGNDGAVTVLATPQPTLFPVTSVPPLGTVCQIYVTYSGVDPQNKLSLRISPSVSAPQVFRVPTDTNVLLVPTSQETEGDGYHWLNVIYLVTPITRYQGWMARDSFSKNGVRDPSIATLRPLGATAPC